MVIQIPTPRRYEKYAAINLRNHTVVPLKLLFEWDGDGDEDLVEEHAFPAPTKMRYS